MINSINVLAGTPINRQNSNQRHKTSLPKLGNDSFVKNSSVTFGKAQPIEMDEEFDAMFPQLAMREQMGSYLEYKGYIERAEPHYKKNFIALDKLIKKQKTRVKDPEIADAYANAVEKYVTNLHAQAGLELEEGHYETCNALREKGMTILKRCLDTNKNILPKLRNKNNLSEYRKLIRTKTGMLGRELPTGELLIAYARDKRGELNDLTPPINTDIMLSREDVLKERAAVTAQIKQKMPDRYSTPKDFIKKALVRADDISMAAEDYDINHADLIDRYKSLSHMAINNALQEPTTASAKKLLNETTSFLMKKDPHNLYWEDDDFDISGAKIRELSKTPRVVAMSENTLDTYLSLTGQEKPTLQAQSQHFEKLQQEPKLLGEAVLFSEDEKTAKYGLHLLATTNDKESQRQIRKVGKIHPVEKIKLFARELAKRIVK